MAFEDEVRKQMESVYAARTGVDEAEEKLKRAETHAINLLLHKEVVITGPAYPRKPYGNGRPTVKLEAERCKIIGVALDEGTNPARDLCWIETSDGRELWCELDRSINGSFKIEGAEVPQTN